ncbi:Fumarate reductase flavoprotein subunit [Neobacillus rhizosphaerae]|uniref:Fumarate reductase flavoprotein subunit n=2 Tax=Neobacillus rhizosphaerae TaxID=2880965 RepID=A0ABN8KNE3_9BACI|nr:Fumarate reductase flavoprotein subunit [Neobacillus rhizosphaerae]
MDRRTFLKAGAVTATATALSVSSLAPFVEAEENTDVEFDEVFDIIVVGSGLAGTTSAITAAEQGNKVLVVDKMNILGGTSLISGLNFSCVGSDEQKARGIKDSPELMAQDMRKVSEDYGDPELALTVATMTTRFYHFLKDRGVVFKEFKQLGGHSVARAVWAGGGAFVIRPLHDYAKKSLADRLTMRKRCRVDNIVFDNGRAVGIQVRENYYFNFDAPEKDDEQNQTGKIKYVGARKGIVFASGGYCRDKKLLGAEADILEETNSDANPGARSGTLQMLLSHGAQAVNLSLFRLAYPIPTEDLMWGMLVNPEGKRFVNEFGNRNTIGMTILKEKQKFDGKAPLLIYDQTGADNFHDKQRFQLSMDAKNGYQGTMYKFQSIKEVAKHFGYDPLVLQKAVADYNAALDSGVDKEFSKDFSQMNGAALKKAPFYAMPLTPKCTYTPGGVRINKAAQMLNSTTGEIFTGLFAAGEATGGVHGAMRLTACSVPDCGAFGLISGDNVSAMIPVELQVKKK